MATITDYSIPDFPAKRMRFFNNQFLSEQDFVDDDAYQIAHARAHMRALCVAGICEGLEVSYPDPVKPPSVTKGTAIDKLGRLIVLAQTTSGSTDIPTKLAPGDYLLYIRFVEVPTDMADETFGGDPGERRFTQQPEIAAAKAGSLPDDAVVLGTFSVKAGLLDGAGSLAGRQYSGVRLPGPTGATLINPPGDVATGALLNTSLTLRRDGAGKLGPVLTLMNGLGGAGAGTAVDFDSYDPGANAPPLRLLSIDDGAFSSHLAVLTKQPGAIGNALVERLRVTNTGMLQFSNEVKDKVVLYDNGPTARYGIGLTGNNINLFYPSGGRFALRIDNSSGTEVFSVDSGGSALAKGGIVTGGNIVSGGNVTLQRNIVALGTTDGSIAQPNEVVGGIGFYGSGRSHGELAYRTDAGFELVDVSANGPRVGYAVTDYPLANLSAGRVGVSTRPFVGTVGDNRQVALNVAGAIQLNDTLAAVGNMHLYGPNTGYLLHKTGVVVSKSWGGTGNLTVEGTTTTAGLVVTTTQTTLGGPAHIIVINGINVLKIDTANQTISSPANYKFSGAFSGTVNGHVV